MSYVLMPSEIARLVYGYIDDLDGCKDVAKQFLETCPLLREFAEGFRCGARYSAKINNKTLLDFLQNLPEEKSDNSISQNLLRFNEDLLISTVNNTITKTFEEAFSKESAFNSRSFSQIKEEQAELKSILKRDLLPNIRETVKDVERNIIQSFRDQMNVNSAANYNLLKTPKRNHKYQGFTQQYLENELPNTSKAPFTPTAHSSMLSTPKRKNMTPKRLPPHPSNGGQYLASRISTSVRPQDSPRISFQSNSPYTDPPSQYSQTSAFTSSPACTDSSELDLQTFQSQVLNSFVEHGSKPEVSGHLADLINSALEPFRPNNTAPIEETNNGAANQQGIQQPQFSNNAVSTEDTQNINQMFNNRDQMSEFLGTATNALYEDPDVNNMFESVILQTPFKSFIPVTPSSGSSNGSLHTPLMNFIDSSNKENTGNADLMPVKNFTKQLESSSRDNSQSQLESSSLASNSFNNTSASSDDIHNVTVVEAAAKHNTSANSSQNSSAYLSFNDSSSISNASLDKSKSSINSQSYRMDTSHTNEPNSGRPSQSSISKPVFLNQHLKSKATTNKKPSFLKLQSQQEYIRKSMNYSGDVSLGSAAVKEKSITASRANKVPSSQGHSSLTTTITKVHEIDPTLPKSCTATSVQPIGFQAVSSQVIGMQANISSQPTQTFIVPPGSMLWDPDTGITTNTADQQLIVQGHFQLCDFQTQAPPVITSTRENVYLPPDFGKSVSNQEANATSSMLMINPVMADSRLMGNDPNSFNGNKKSATCKPSILSKYKTSSPCKVPSTNSLQMSGVASPTTRSQKEPRKSNHRKRSFPDDEPAGQSSQRQRQSDERSLPSQPNKGGAINSGPVKALMNADLDVFLQTVHKEPNVVDNKSNDASSKKSSKRSPSKSEQTKKSPSVKSTKRSGKGRK